MSTCRQIVEKGSCWLPIVSVDLLVSLDIKHKVCGAKEKFELVAFSPMPKVNSYVVQSPNLPKIYALSMGKVF